MRIAAGAGLEYAERMQRRHHYERAFEAFLRRRAVPYVSVNEAKRALLPDQASLRVVEASSGGGVREAGTGGDQGRPIKSFDVVIYGERLNLLVEVKGRRISPPTSAPFAKGARAKVGGAAGAGSGSVQGVLPMSVAAPFRRPRMECWATMQDLDGLRTWRNLFGAGFEAVLVFVYWCEAEPPSGLFSEVLSFDGRWYSVRAIELDVYRGAMKLRSPRWGTVDLPTAEFERLSEPFEEYLLRRLGIGKGGGGGPRGR